MTIYKQQLTEVNFINWNAGIRLIVHSISQSSTTWWPDRKGLRTQGVTLYLHKTVTHAVATSRILRLVCGVTLYLNKTVTRAIATSRILRLVRGVTLYLNKTVTHAITASRILRSVRNLRQTDTHMLRAITCHRQTLTNLI